VSPQQLEFDAWRVKQAALEAAVEGALAHALVAAGPVRTDAHW
jgi:hypothetical protein